MLYQLPSSAISNAERSKYWKPNILKMILISKRVANPFNKTRTEIRWKIAKLHRMTSSGLETKRMPTCAFISLHVLCLLATYMQMHTANAFTFMQIYCHHNNGTFGFFNTTWQVFWCYCNFFQWMTNYFGDKVWDENTTIG